MSTKKEAASSTLYPVVDTEFVVELLYKDLMLTFYTKGEDADEDLNCRIEQAWFNKYGVPFRPEDADYVNPTVLHGPPGHGKTTSYKVASTQVARDLGLNFVINPDESYIPTKDDFVFVSYELSGQVSTTDFGGLPAKKTIQDTEYMSKIPNYRLAVMKLARTGVLLLDDIANGSPSIQNVALSIAEERRFQGMNLGNVMVGCTANLGAMDGTNTSPLSSALIARCRNFEVRDTVENFVKRTQREFKDAVGDAGLCGFLSKYKDSFTVDRVPKSSPFPCPRTWRKLLGDLRRFVGDNANSFKDPRSAALPASTQLQWLASSIVGFDAAGKLSAYIHSLYTGAAPIASEMMDNGKLSEEKETMMKSRMGTGHSSEGHEFAYQYAVALADECAARLYRDQDDPVKVSKLYQNFAVGLTKVEPTSIMFTVNHLMGRLENMNLFSNEDGGLAFEQKKKMVEIISRTPNITKVDLQTVIDTLSNYVKHQTDYSDNMKY